MPLRAAIIGMGGIGNLHAQCYRNNPLADTGMKVFEDTFPVRINAFLEDVSGKIPFDYIRSSGREALGVMEVLFAAIKSDQNGGDAVIPEKLPPLHGDVSRLNY